MKFPVDALEILVDVLEAGKRGRFKDLSDFDKSQTVMSGWLNISNTAGLVGLW